MSRSYAFAIRYACRGWAVFPLKPRSKAPATSNGFKNATTTLEQIRTWWDAMPDAGVGIATGAISQLVVLDVDPRSGGDESLVDLEARHGALPETPVSITGGGGSHSFFRHPGGVIPCRAGLPGFPGLDLKGDGGYVVGAGSIHPETGQLYAWNPRLSPAEVELAPCPPKLLALAAQREDPERIPYRRTGVSAEAESRIANAIARSDIAHARFHERSRTGLNGGANGASESEVDFSLACSLAMAGLEGAEIEHAIRESRMAAGLQEKRSTYYTSTIGKALGLAADSRGRAA